MDILLQFIFIFFIGSTLGWIAELFFRRIVHGKWVNPGFLIGPYLPIYGFGLCALTGIYLVFQNFNLPAIVVILLMGLAMTLIELVGGLSFVNKPVKLWDYSDRWGNYKGIICPLFSLIWTVIGAIYYYFLAGFILEKIEWFNNNLSFSFVLGFFCGVILIDYVYSTKMLSKVREYAKESGMEVRYEELKCQIRELQEKRKEKYSFLFAFKQPSADLKEFIDNYKKKARNKREENKMKREKEKEISK